MNTEFLVLIALLLLAGMIIFKYVWWSVTRNLRDMARFASDPQARTEKIQQLGEIIKNNPQDKVALLQRGHLYQYADKHLLAAVDLRAYTALAADDCEGWAELAESLLRSSGAAEAVMAAQQAVSLDANYADYRVLYMRAALAAGDLATAQAQFAEWCQLSGYSTNGVSEDCRSQQSGRNTSDNPWAVFYQAALLQAGEKTNEAEALLCKLSDDDLAYLKGLIVDDPVFAKAGALICDE